jgi:sigma-54 specific flagellar transcriptional regulator A
MDYVLVTDDCEDCRYVSNAFSMLKLSLKSIKPEIAITDKDGLENALFILICKNTESKHHKQLAKVLESNQTPVVLFTEKSKTSPYPDSAVHYLKIPFSKYELTDVLCHIKSDTHHNENHFEIGNHGLEKLVGHSAHARKIKSMIKQVANSDSTVLILGQSGTGKDVIASCIHQLSNRKSNPFVPINCGAIPSELIESELFGHEKGAFTGALARRAGRFEIANTGTLFLDEIGDMPLLMQVKLLRVIQDRIIERVGGNVTVPVNVRLIAATNKNLEDLIQQNRFREDLFYRLNVFPILVPSLAERSEDIPLLIEYNLDKIYERLNHRVLFTERALGVLCEYSWPGNIRELQNFLERMVILHPNEVVDEKEINSTLKKDPTPAATVLPQIPLNTAFDIKDYIAQVERQVIQVVLEQSNGAVNAAAEYLSLGRNTLLEKLKKYNLINT